VPDQVNGPAEAEQGLLRSVPEMPEAPAGDPVSDSETGPRVVTTRELLDLRERSWVRRLQSVSLVAEAEIRVEHSTQAAHALGRIYAKLTDQPDVRVHSLLRWPACVASAMVGVAVSGYEAGTYWPALWKIARYSGAAQDQAVWGQAFTLAVERLGMPTFSGMPLRYLGPILMHAGIPAYCLGDYFRLLLERRRRDPGMDAESFLAWATSPGHESRLFVLDVPARRFLIQGGEYAHDVVDRSLDLLERLSEPDPDLAGIRLPAYVIEAARVELDAGRLDLSAARRRTGTSHERQSRPRIGLDPFGEGVRVILPAVGDAPDGVALWRVTADGTSDTVQSRALWVGAAEAAPETTYPLPRAVRSVLVSLAGRDLTAELQVVDPADPILFFTDDGRQVLGSLALPRGQLWILHPADRELVVTEEADEVTEPPVPFGWEGWRLRLVSLDNVQAVSLNGGRSHSVHGQARPRLLLGEPIRGVTTPYGSPVYDQPPRLVLPGSPNVPISWHVDVRPAVGTASPLVNLNIDGPSELDLGRHLPQPLLGAFDVTVRGPLGRGMRRTIFVAERLTVSYRPGVRALSPDGLRPGTAALTAAIGATALPPQLRFGSRERARVIEYRSAGETEPLVVTPPHVSVICPGAGVTTWTAAPLHLTTETFADAGRLLVRVPDSTEPRDLEVWVGGQRAQVIPASGQRSPGLAGYELARGGDTIAEHGRAELVLSLADAPMPVGIVRRHRVACGADLDSGQIQLRDYRHVDGLVAGIYLVLAPWRRPSLQPVPADGIVALPDELRNAGPLQVMLRVEDPWTTSGWPTWPGSGSFTCDAPGVPSSGDAEQDLLSRFAAGHGELSAHLSHPERVWQLVHLANDLVRSGARADLTERCGEALRSQPGAALLSLLETGFNHKACITALILTGMAAILPETPSGLAAMDQASGPDSLTSAGQLWSALPAAAAILTGQLLPTLIADADDPRAGLAENAIAQCGDSLRTILRTTNDRAATVGRFGPEAEQMAHWSPAQVDSLWQAAAVVPQALLDADTRMTAARRLFDARRTPEFRRAAASATSVMNTTQGMIRSSRYPSLLGQLLARHRLDGPSGWRAVPAMSAALALVARLAARGNAACRSYERAWRDLWAGLATQAPEQVITDLVLAEALLAGADAARMAKEIAKRRSPDES
jgi:hypothetical protein